MQQTANYNLNLPEGTDVVNPLVDYNPNFRTIDSAMKANANRTVGRATCVKSGNTHVVTRSNTGSNIINFTATGDWNTGDSMTIDSTPVSVFLPDGTAALDGAYLINSEVFGILNGTRFTLYSNSVDVTNKADKTDIATIESGTTASRAYSIEELVYVSGTLYRVISAIASGATFTVGTNIEAANVNDALSRINSAVTVKQTANTSVTLAYDGIVGYAQDTNKLLVTIPFPFFTKNTNYSVSDISWYADGIGSPTNINVINKRNNSLTMTGTATAAYARICPSSVIVTITFA